MTDQLLCRPLSLGLFLIASVVLAADPIAKPLPPGKNLIPNGDFEQGEVTPVGWQSIDGLSSFWVQDDDPRHGKVLKVDTDVLQSQAYSWWKKIRAGALPKDAPKKEPTREPKYDTLAGLDGVWFWSDPVPVEPGRSYWLSLDVKGAEIMVWLVGYEKKPDISFGADEGAFIEYVRDSSLPKPPTQKRGHAAFLHNYEWKGQLKAGGPNEWRTYSRREKPFSPTANTPEVRWVRVLLYPYWPPGIYYVDNVRLVEYKPPR